MDNLWKGQLLDFLFLLQLIFDLFFQLALFCGLLQMLRKIISLLYAQKSTIVPSVGGSLLLLAVAFLGVYLFPVRFVQGITTKVLQWIPNSVNEILIGIYPSICVVWFSITLFFLVYKAKQWVALKKQVKMARKSSHDSAFSYSCAQYPRVKVPEVMELVGIQSPGLIGWRRPVIVIPVNFAKNYTESQRIMLYLHELAHIQQHDYPFYTILNFLGALCWMHIPIKNELSRMHQSCEIVADKKAVLLSNQTPITYGELLLATLRQNNQLPLAFSARSYREIKLRLNAIVSSPKVNVVPTLAAILLVLPLLFMGARPKNEQIAYTQIKIEYRNQQIKIVPLEAMVKQEEQAVKDYLLYLPEAEYANITHISFGKTSFYREGLFGAYTILEAEELL